MMSVTVRINGRDVTAEIEPRLSLADFVRERGRLTGTHLGCEHGVCGACTILLERRPVRSCIMLAASAEGSAVQTIEGFAGDEVMAVLRQAFSDAHGLQCGFCTPGMLITAWDIVRRRPDADERRIREELSGNMCRCTGYMGIVEALQLAISRLRHRDSASPEFA